MYYLTLSCTYAGTVASWWLLPNQEINTRSAFKRAVTTSLGSICLGSLIIAIIKAVRYAYTHTHAQSLVHVLRVAISTVRLCVHDTLTYICPCTCMISGKPRAKRSATLAIRITRELPLLCAAYSVCWA